MANQPAAAQMKRFRPVLKNWQGWAIAMTLAVLILFFPLPAIGAAPTERTLRIEASMFQFTPAEITLNPGDRVTVELVATDVVHGFSLDGYDIELTADPGQTATGTFVADKAGVFTFRCLVPCGNLHPFMLGKLQVGPNMLFWRAIILGILAVMVGLWSVRR